MSERNACLQANHGVQAFGHQFDQAQAIGLEALCERYRRACQLGQPVLLDTEEMATVLDKFADYGQPS